MPEKQRGMAGPLARRIRQLAAIVLLASVAGLVFAWSGLYNVAAVQGHWPVTSWFLRFTMRKSVELHARAVEAPDNLGDPRMIEAGAAFYDAGCAPCHGGPGFAGNLIPHQMLPPAPVLADGVGEWTPEQLFWIAKHGLKYTGMPGWPAPERDDEVWALTAFLLRIGETDPAEYRRLARGEAAPAGQGAAPARQDAVADDPGQLFTIEEGALLAACARCHGLDGGGRTSGRIPRLDGQSADYLALALHDYASGLRGSGVMEPIAAELGESERRQVAQLFSGRRGSRGAPPSRDAAALQLGERIAVAGVPERQTPACAACHGLAEGPANPLYPSLAGQHARYLADQLRLWQGGIRGGTNAEIMAHAARGLEPAEIEAVAVFYESLRD